MNFENITENMNDDGYDGTWYSVIDGMTCYRIRTDDETNAVYDQENNFIDTYDDEKAQNALDELVKYLSKGNR